MGMVTVNSNNDREENTGTNTKEINIWKCGQANAVFYRELEQKHKRKAMTATRRKRGDAYKTPRTNLEMACEAVRNCLEPKKTYQILGQCNTEKTKILLWSIIDKELIEEYDDRSTANQRKWVATNKGVEFMEKAEALLDEFPFLKNREHKH